MINTVGNLSSFPEWTAPWVDKKEERPWELGVDYCRYWYATTHTTGKVVHPVTAVVGFFPL